MLEYDIIIVGGGFVGCCVVVEIVRKNFSLNVVVVVKIYFICFYFVVV